MSPRARMGLFAAGITVLLFTSAAVIVLTAGGLLGDWKRSTGPTSQLKHVSASQADNWDIRQLADWLRANGLPKLEIVIDRGGTVFFALYADKNSEDLRGDIVQRERFPDDCVTVYEHKSASDAAQSIRDADDEGIKMHYGWGKFVFFGHPDDLAIVAKHLR